MNPVIATVWQVDGIRLLLQGETGSSRNKSGTCDKCPVISMVFPVTTREHVKQPKQAARQIVRNTRIVNTGPNGTW